MKKLVFLATFMVAISFAACGGQTETAKATTDSDTVEVIDTMVVEDTLVLDSAVAE